MYNLELALQDCQQLKDKVREDKVFAQNLYAALCNIQWRHKKNEGEWWSCTWRYAGGLVAGLRCQGENYETFYCSGCGFNETEGYVKEGIVVEEIEDFLYILGWEWREWQKKEWVCNRQ